jgi:hypothetical protein
MVEVRVMDKVYGEGSGRVRVRVRVRARVRVRVMVRVRVRVRSEGAAFEVDRDTASSRQEFLGELRLRPSLRV